MAIKYLAGNRIQGNSTDGVETVTKEYDGSTGATGWTEGGTSNKVVFENNAISGETNATYVDAYAYAYDLGADVTGDYVLDFTAVMIDNTGSATGNACSWIVGLATGTGAPTGEDPSQSNLEFCKVNTVPSGTPYVYVRIKQDSGSTATYSAEPIFTVGSSTTTTRYVRLSKSGTSTSVKFFSDSARTVQVGSTVTKTGGATGSSQNVRYLFLKMYSQNTSNTWEWTFDDFIFYNGVSSTATSEKNGITNIPENSIFEETDTGEHYLRAKYGWFKFGDTGSMPNHRGIFTGGDDSNNPIDYITIATLGNSADFGDGGSTGKMGAAVGNGTLGIYGGDDNVLNQVTIATTANSTDFGDLTGIGGNATACADATRGVWFRGNINYITMASASNATDWGHDRSPNAGDPCAFADTTRGIVAGGETNEGGWHDINDMDYITIQTISATTDFGDMTDVKRQLSGVANDTYGFTMAGYNGSSYLSTIDYVTIQTLGNASSFGNLTQARTAQNSACGDSTRAVLGGGHTGSSSVNTIDYFTMGTSGSSSDFGDLTSARTRVMSCSDYVK